MSEYPTNEKQAEPLDVLEARIMNVTVPKTGAEWWARREIERLSSELAEARDQLERCGKENCMGYRAGDLAMWVREERLLRTERERDEARQALEAERARVAELEELVREHGPHGPLCASGYSAGVWADTETLPKVQHLRLPCNCWKSRALAAEGNET